MRGALPVCMLVPAIIGFAAEIRVHDGFEAADLSGIWMSARFVPGAVRMQSKIARSGKGAVEITLRKGDLSEPGGPGNPVVERAELMEAPALWALEGITYTYSFSVFIPRDFPIVPTRLVIAQWKQFCPAGRCTPDNPVLSVRYAAGELLVQQRTGPKSTALYRTKEDARNRWLDFRFEVRFSRQPDGFVRAWLNDRPAIEHRGITAYQAQGGYPGNNRFYFKMGLYRDEMAEPMTIYVDEYRKEEATR